ncbi:MAG TPA: hypothetical protein VGL72_22350 [Bryobacteraceae bacterium]|jgi:hypothetical protein
MATEKQIAANQANAQRSTGPATEAGKKRSALNALRHGLTGHVVVLPEEDQQAYDLFAKNLLPELDVDGAHEETLANLYIGTLWKIQRAHATEDVLYSLGLMQEVAEHLNIEDPQAHNAVSNAKFFQAESATFSRLSLYMQRLVNQSNALLKQLKQVQATRRPQQQAEIREAIRAYKFKQMQGESFDPQEFGFVCSTQRIELYIRRHQLDRHAETAEKCGYNPAHYQKMAA